MSKEFLDEMKDISKDFTDVDILDDISELSDTDYNSSIIETEVFSENNKASSYVVQKTFSEISEQSSEEDTEVINILKNGEIPEKKIVNRLKATSLGINLAQLSLAKKLGGKLATIENYLSLLEDKLFDKKNIEAMNMEDTLTLYQSTRLLFEKTNDMLMKIQSKVDIDAIEMEIKTMSANVENDEDLSLNNSEDLDEIMKLIKDRKKQNDK